MTSKKAKVPTSGHKEGSRKGRVHALFDKEGQDVAWTLGLKLKLSPNTLRAWFGTWRRLSAGKKAKAVKTTFAGKERSEIPATLTEPNASAPSV